jgi:N-acylglucosamine-6-phosphate 2-epimerase
MDRSTQLAQIRQTLDKLAGGIVVSCQARPGNPLDSVDSMVRMARAAELGGARAIRANGPANCKAILSATDLPVVAINRINHHESRVSITPTVNAAAQLLDIGAKVLALDATSRRRPGDETLHHIVGTIHGAGGVALGDLSSALDLEGALAADIDAVGTTLSGYTGGPISDEPDFEFVGWLVKHSPVPVYAEGRYWTPDHVHQAFAIGASFVVVGNAITNPMAITSRFVRASPGIRKLQ